MKCVRVWDVAVFYLELLEKNINYGGARERRVLEKLTARGVDLDTKVQLDERVEAREHTSAGDTAKNVGTSTVHERHEALLLDDLREAVEGAAVLLGLARGHHHATTHRVDWVRDEARGDRDGVAERERHEETSVVAEHNRLERIVEAEVAAAIDDDAHARDDEAAVETGDAVRGERLAVDVDQAVELTLAGALLGRLGVVGETRTSVVERVDEAQAERTGDTARRDVLAERDSVRVGLARLECGLNLILEGKVKRLCGKVTDAVGQVATPECV